MIKALALAAKIHRDEVGDGVSTFLVLISTLLNEAEKLIEMRIHPVTILEGYKEAFDKSIKIIDEMATDYNGNLEDSLTNMVDCGRGLLNEKLRASLSQAVDIIQNQEGTDVTRIKIEKKPGGSIDDSKVVEGVIIKKRKGHRSMPDEVESPKVALVSKRPQLKGFEQLAVGEGPFSARAKITDTGQIQEFLNEERNLRAKMVEKVKMSGANVLLCRTKIDEHFFDMLSRAGIFAVEMADLEEVSRATGAKIVPDFNHLTSDDLGEGMRLEIDKIKPEEIAILYCKGAATVLLRGGSPELIQELEKVVKRALLVIKHSRAKPKVVPGGGAVFAKLAKELSKFSRTFSGRQQLAIKAFADAMETIPRWLATNYGLDPIDTIAKLRNLHTENQTTMGIGETGCADMLESNVIELASINKATIWRTFEVASLLLKIDDYFHVKELPLVHKQ